MFSPPSSVQSIRSKDKENIAPRRRTVDWANETKIHWISSDADTSSSSISSAASSSSSARLKSILKPSKPLAPLPFPETKPRETTPQPEDPMGDAAYLCWPINTILAKASTIRERTEAYSILLARLRDCIEASTTNRSRKGSVNASAKLFLPIKENNASLASMIIHDLGSVLIDPLDNSSRDSYLDSDDIPVPEDAGSEDSHTTSLNTGLPSPPKNSPKRGGLTESQVKRSRDLCMLSHAVLKFLHVTFALISVSTNFTAEHLCGMLEAVLAIPLAERLPTGNARKTCALAISLLQNQRLPRHVLEPCKDRIVTALQRAIDGELGKEGKKGSASDGLKAIHELCSRFPAVFVSALEPLFPNVLALLLSPSPAIRLVAAHALGGYVLGITTSMKVDSEEFAKLHEQLAEHVATFLLTSQSSPSATASDSAILAQLRHALRQTELDNIANSPAWSLCIVSSFIVILGPALLDNILIFKIIEGLLQIARSHKLGAVRLFSTTVWRPLVWVWSQFYDEADVEDAYDIEEHVEDDQVGAKLTRISMKKPRDAKSILKAQVVKKFEELMLTAIDGRNGISLIGVYLSQGGQRQLARLTAVLKAMAGHGGTVASSSINILHRLVVPDPSASNPGSTATHEEIAAHNSKWTRAFTTKLLPKSLFSVMPGLLNTDIKLLSHSTKSILNEVAGVVDLRNLYPHELKCDLLWEGLLGAWRECVTNLQLQGSDEIPRILVEVWEALIKGRTEGVEDEKELLGVARYCADELVEIFNDPAATFLPVTEKPGTPSTTVTSSPIPPTSPAGTPPPSPPPIPFQAIKLAVLRQLWTSMSSVFSQTALCGAANRLLMSIFKNEDTLFTPTPDQMPPGQSLPREAHTRIRTEWAHLCARLASVGPSIFSKILWRGCRGQVSWKWDDEERALVWRSYARSWREGQCDWEGATVILGLPFDEKYPCRISDADLSEWDALLQYSLAQGYEKGFPASAVIDHIATQIDKKTLLESPRCSQTVDMLVSLVDLSADADLQLPSTLLDLVQDTLIFSYPPQSSNKVVSLWLLRSLVTVIDACPLDMVVSLLYSLLEGLIIWLTDSAAMFSLDEYSREIIPLYQTILLRLQSLSDLSPILNLSGLLPAALREDKKGGSEARDSFDAFWTAISPRLQVPEGGWPSDILRALAVVRAQFRLIPADFSLESEDIVEDLLDDYQYDADVSYSSADHNEDKEVEVLDPESEDETMEDVAVPCEVQYVIKVSSPVVNNLEKEPAPAPLSSSTNTTLLQAITLVPSPKRLRSVVSSGKENALPDESKSPSAHRSPHRQKRGALLPLSPSSRATKKARLCETQADDEDCASENEPVSPFPLYSLPKTANVSKPEKESRLKRHRSRSTVRRIPQTIRATSPEPEDVPYASSDTEESAKKNPQPKKPKRFVLDAVVIPRYPSSYIPGIKSLNYVIPDSEGSSSTSDPGSSSESFSGTGFDASHVITPTMKRAAHDPPSDSSLTSSSSPVRSAVKRRALSQAMSQRLQLST